MFPDIDHAAKGSSFHAWHLIQIHEDEGRSDRPGARLAATGLAATHASAAETVSPSFSSAFNNTGIATNSAPGLADLDGSGNSLSADALNAAGWTRGASVTVNATTYTLPDVAPGQKDNIVADEQTVPVSGAGNALGFLLTATGGSVSGSGTVHYDDGTTSAYGLEEVGDWVTGRSVVAAVVLSRSARATTPVKLYAVTVPIAQGKTVTSVTLPPATPGKRLHIFSTAVRSTPAAPGGAFWTGSWGTAFSSAYPTNKMGAAYPDWMDQTFRMVVSPHTSGATARLRFANTFSPDPLKLGHVTVATQAVGGSATQAPVTLTFRGSQQATIPAGGEVVSDPVLFPITAGKNLLVSYHLPGPVKMFSYHGLAKATSYTTAWQGGDRTADVGETAFTRKDLTFWGLLNGIDVATSDNPGTIVALGDSQTDAAHSSMDANRRWPDFYAAFLKEKGDGSGVLNAGISSNRLVTDPADFPDDTKGPSALSRLDRDVFAQPNVREVVLYEGVNDIVHQGSSAAAVTAGIKKIAAQAHARGIRVTVATIPGFSGYTAYPALFASSNFRIHEAVRQSVNAYIRTTSDIDAYVDFDLATRDTDDPYALRSTYAITEKEEDTDGLHFNDTGTELLARTLAERTNGVPLPMGETVSADFNGDSISDILARHDPSGALQMRLGLGDGTFAAPTHVTYGWQDFSQTVAGDFAGNDGKADIMARYDGPTGDKTPPRGTLMIWVNRGDGTFGTPTPVTQGWEFTQTTAADFDGNHTTDLIARDADGNLKIWSGLGTGKFQGPWQLTAGWNFTQTTAADFNGDHAADIIARDPATNRLKIWTHNADGYFNAPTNLTGGWIFGQTTAVADLDGDDKADLIARDDTTGTLKAWTGRGDTTFTAARNVIEGW
ncbi:FG-GAP-like repeat-containing protein [Streptomyces sp. PanSC19]|uniref:FG-GAP-like repeat-containing protein n=1 Tax=Streptomyces sp. PanSC19 TaxID=1520455 RepID=UPI0011CE0C69|nr:FG-GAP-like repeat-containing protein [Streptomyces sp. PanSC19]